MEDASASPVVTVTGPIESSAPQENVSDNVGGRCGSPPSIIGTVITTVTGKVRNRNVESRRQRFSGLGAARQEVRYRHHAGAHCRSAVLLRLRDQQPTAFACQASTPVTSLDLARTDGLPANANQVSSVRQRFPSYLMPTSTGHRFLPGGELSATILCESLDKRRENLRF